ncbi:MAG: hypothetical protein PHH77_07610, partial [Victivallaceae bacterium]|nr:hypothetical protein [Victivallaceae bacterium]
MKNIAYQQPLFHTRRENNIKEYRDLIDRLELVDQILVSSGVEFSFAAYHLDQVTANGIERFGNPDFKLNSKQKRHYTLQAVQALRCNFLKHELKCSCRQLAFHIAASEDIQRFLFAGDFISAKCPGKTRINNYASIVPESFLTEINDVLRHEFTVSENVEKYGLEQALDDRTLWLDATCLKANIHFPVDWVLLRDAVRTIVKSILCMRRHSLKHRIAPPETFLSTINTFCMEMSNRRRRKEALKKRKDTLRRMKKIANIVKQHGQRYLDLLKTRRDKTDLSEKEAARIIERIENVLQQLPAAIAQAHKRIISGEKLDPEEKIISLYDPSAAVIVRGKAGAEVEFGNELFITEQADGFIVDWHLYEDKVSDQQKLRDFIPRTPSDELTNHTLVGDRGFFGEPNKKLLAKHGIINHLCPKSPEEYSMRREED